MAIVTGKDELCRIDNFTKYFKALQGYQGKTLFYRYDSLNNIVNKHIESNYQSFLAHPVQQNEDTITFYGKRYHETPRLLSELQGEDLVKYTNIKEDVVAHYNAVIEKLTNSGKTTEAEFLDGATKHIDDRFVYCYDNSIVLGVWGMLLRDNVREDISEIRKNLVKRKNGKVEPPPEPRPENTLYSVKFISGENGKLSGNDVLHKRHGEEIYVGEIPGIESKLGYEFIGWGDIDPKDYLVSNDIEFTAQYREKSVLPPILPWYERFWNWLQTLFLGRGCLRWLLWLLLFLLLLFLLMWLFRSCNDNTAGGAALSNNDSTWINEDPNVGKEGGIYDPNNPYQSIPTPPGYEGILPPNQGVLPPLGENPHIIPGNPAILGNRLNILMENEDKSILDLAKDFKTKYPEDKYKIVYYDDVVKRMQIEIPEEEREKLKEEIPLAFVPEYELFVFDEALFEGNYIPNDPALSDEGKSWYLKAVKAPQAWDITRGAEKITIAVVDNGFNLKHPELAAKVVVPYNVWKHSAEVFPQEIDHGTHVAGIALATADNGVGISGIAPNCKFMPVQVADENGLMTTTSVLDGILYSLYQGADVVNVSLGSQFSTLTQFSKEKQQDLIRNHFKEEERLWRRVMRIAANHNSTLVIAAGNNNVLAGIDALQRPELFVTVSAVDKNNQNLNKAQFSNYGSYTTISAPGVGIYSSVGKNGYASMDGTSMAAPIVAGAIALMKSINDTITTKQIICILQNTGVETQGSIGKLIQLDKALLTVKSGKPVDCTPSPSSGDVQILLSWNNYNDLDLICTDPNGERIFFRNPNVSSGGQLEIDMNVEYPDSKTPIENIFWEPKTAPQGTYNVYLAYYKRHQSQINETAYSIMVKYGEKVENYNGVIKKEDNALHICTFTLGTPKDNPVTQDPNAPPDNRRMLLEQERKQLQKELDRINKELEKIGNNL